MEIYFFKEFSRFFSYNRVRKKILIKKGAQSMKRKQITAMITTMTMVLGITACGAGNVSAEQENKNRQKLKVS